MDPQSSPLTHSLPADRWPRQVVMLVTDRGQCAGRPLAEVVDAAIEGGVNAVQLREKDLPAAELLVLARQLRGVCGHRALFFVNDRVDVALLSGADGVHLGERGLPVSAVRQMLPPSLKVGKSVHSINAARQAELDGADYLLLGTIYESASHPGAGAAGPQLIRDVAARVGIPVIAIGGIDAERARECRDAGASGVAALSAILQATDPREAARSLAPAPEGA